MSAALSKNTPKSYLHLGIMLAIMFIFRLPVPPEGLTAEGMAVIGIFFAVLYGWLFLDIVWPSLLGLVALGLAINEPMTEVIGSAFGNSTVLLILLFCMVASIINAAGIAEWSLYADTHACGGHECPCHHAYHDRRRGGRLSSY